MDIQTAKNNLLEGATTGYEILKKVAIWSGRKLEIGYTNYLVPTIKTLWAWGLVGLEALKKAVQTGPGALFGVASGLFLIGVTAFKIADHKAYDENIVAMTTWKALGIIAFLGATAATSLGIAALAAV